MRADRPGASAGTFFVRWGDQSSGSTYTPLVRLTTLRCATRPASGRRPTFVIVDPRPKPAPSRDDTRAWSSATRTAGGESPPAPAPAAGAADAAAAIARHARGAAR